MIKIYLHIAGTGKLNRVDTTPSGCRALAQHASTNISGDDIERWMKQAQHGDLLKLSDRTTLIAMDMAVENPQP